MSEMMLEHILSAHPIADDAANLQTMQVADALLEDGFAVIEPTFYQSDRFDNFKELIAAQLDYYSLKPDPLGGGRHRSYSRYILAPGSDTPVLSESNDYMQSPEYNYDDGGKVRQFAPLSNAFAQSPLLQHVLARDLAVARRTDLVDWSREVIVGLHQVRYLATPDAPAISSPLWLHRDDEPVVFVHLFNLNAAVLGGDNLISSGGRKIDRVIRLTRPLDTLLVGQKILHAVTPVGTSVTSGAFRDVLLVTFSNESK